MLHVIEQIRKVAMSVQRQIITFSYLIERNMPNKQGIERLLKHLVRQIGSGRYVYIPQ